MREGGGHALTDKDIEENGEVKAVEGAGEESSV